MKIKIILASLLLTGHLTAYAESAQNIQWLQAPLVKTLPQWSANKTLSAESYQKQAVQYNIDLNGQMPEVPVTKGYLAESKSFYLDVSGQDLNKGVNVPLSSHTAVIRLSSLNKSTTLETKHLQLSQDSAAITSKTMVTGEQLKAIGMTVPEHSIAMKINHQPGNMQLKLLGDQFASDESFVIHVFEPDSQHRLTMSTDKQLYQIGEAFNVHANVLNNKQALPATVKGYITQPNGEKFADLAFSADVSGQMVAKLPALPFVSMNDGLWEVHTLAEAQYKGQTILRDVSSAFAVSAPSAQFNGQLALSKTGITLGIEAMAASRYEVSGVLMGHNKFGDQQAIALLMSADWLEKGSHNISFSLPHDLILSSGLTAPFTVKQLSLKNQSLMAPVQQLAAGFEFTIH